MSHYAVISLPLYNHVNALQAFALQLIVRGHQVTFIPRFLDTPERAIKHASALPQKTLLITCWPMAPARPPSPPHGD